MCVFVILDLSIPECCPSKYSVGSDLFILTKSGCSEYARKCSPGSGAILSLMFMFPHRPVSSSTTISCACCPNHRTIYLNHSALSHCCDFVILTPFGIFLPFLYLHIDQLGFQLLSDKCCFPVPPTKLRIQSLLTHITPTCKYRPRVSFLTSGTTETIHCPFSAQESKNKSSP